MQDIQYYYNYFFKNQNTSLPFAMELDSGVLGPHVMFVGGTHGSEPAGVIAGVEIHKILNSGGVKPKQGKVTFVLGNPEAFVNGQRFIEKNLNRAFSEEISDNLEGLRAQEFRDYFVAQKVDYLIDLHSVSVGDIQMVIYFHNSNTQKVAMEFSPIGTHLLANAEVIPGTLVEEINRFGGQGFAIECGNHNDPKTVKVAGYHIISCMRYFGLVEYTDFELPDLDIAKEVYTYEVFDIIKPQLDFKFVDQNVTTGTFVKEGEIFVNYQGGEYKAIQDLYVVMPDLRPNIKDHDAGFLCTREVSVR